jgi:hypothetical protein
MRPANKAPTESGFAARGPEAQAAIHGTAHTAAAARVNRRRETEEVESAGVCTMLLMAAVDS